MFRRAFLKSAALAATAHGGHPLGANDTLNVGVIGTAPRPTTDEGAGQSAKSASPPSGRLDNTSPKPQAAPDGAFATKLPGRADART